jgi:hypothetical protein
LNPLSIVTMFKIRSMAILSVVPLSSRTGDCTDSRKIGQTPRNPQIRQQTILIQLGFFHADIKLLAEAIDIHPAADFLRGRRGLFGEPDRK